MWRRARLLWVLAIVLAGCSGASPSRQTPEGAQPASGTASAPPVVAATSDGSDEPGAAKDAPAAEASATSGACRNSVADGCGALSFTTPPRNDPMAVQVTFTPEHPRTGDVVTFTVSASDPDAEPFVCSTPDFLYGDPEPASCGRTTPHPAQRGPWDPPERVRVTRTYTFSHRYGDAMNSSSHDLLFTFAVDLTSYTPGWGGHPDPYMSLARASVVVRVRPTLPVDLPMFGP